VESDVEAGVVANIKKCFADGRPVLQPRGVLLVVESSGGPGCREAEAEDDRLGGWGSG